MDLPLPKLPGMVFTDPREPVKRKPQSLNYVNGYAVPGDKLVADVPEAASVELTKAPGSLPMMETLPAWVAYDRKVLRFNAYFKESVTESHEENYRVRKCVIYFYLEDESIHVAEPKQQNSGIPQGVFLKRHRIPTAAAGFYSWSDLNVGESVTFYGRTFYVYSCDPFTRKFITGSGLQVADDQEAPEEPIEAYRNSLKKVKSGGPPKPRNDDLTRFVEAKLGKASSALVQDKLRQFLENDRKVLRFYCVWDDRSRLYGDRRPYVMHYFLADDTIEILEVNETNNGHDPFPVMLRRNPLPNQKLEVDALGPTKSYTHYTWKDFKVGETLNVLSRTFLIHGCDEFTAGWYDANGCDIGTPPDIKEPYKLIPKMEMPPYNGFGSNLDTMQNCISLIPKPPKKDFHKLMNNEKKVMRFTARMVEDDKHALTAADHDRKFILSYFLADDTVSIFEPPTRNSGIIGGKFLERGQILKADGKTPYGSSDFYVGEKLKVFSRTFELSEADGYTYGYMEEHPEEFPKSNFGKVMEEVKTALVDKDEELRTAFIEMDVDGSGYLNDAELAAALAKANVTLTPQEVITIVRKYDVNGDGRISIEEFFSAFGFRFEE